MSVHRIGPTAAWLITTSLLAPLTTLPTPALAGLNDDDLYCEEVLVNGEIDIVCDTVGNIRLECRVYDEGNTTERCQDVNRKLVTPLSLTAGDSGGDGRPGGPLTHDLDLTTGVTPLN